MSINRLSLANTFQQWLTSTDSVIALLNSMTDGTSDQALANLRVTANSLLQVLTVNTSITAANLTATNVDGLPRASTTANGVVRFAMAINAANAIPTLAVTANQALAIKNTAEAAFTAANNATGTFASNVLTFLQAPTSANLRAALTDETGSGAAVFAQTPTFVQSINITTSSNGSFATYSGATNGYTYATVSNSGGTFRYGVAGAINTVFSGSSVYAAVFGSTTDTNLELATNGQIRVVISNTGDITFATGAFLRAYSTVIASTKTVGPTEVYITCNFAGTSTFTLPAPTFGRELHIRTITANPVVASASVVVPLIGGAASTAILSGVAGKWALLVADGSNWQIMAGN